MGIEPLVLKMLRETSGYSIEDVAKKLEIGVEKIENVEEGKSSFNLKQIKILANFYQRPLVAFFEDSAPKLPVIPDHRINRNKKITPQVFLAERRAYYLSKKIAELSNKKSEIPSFPENIKANELAQTFKESLKLSNLKFKKTEELLEYYKELLEEKLLISIIEYPFKADDVRAFCIYSDISIITLNEQDRPEIKLFSLFHEVCHLLRKTSGICSIFIEGKGQQKIEYYCNDFSAEFLVPASNLKRDVGSSRYFNISKLSKNYNISKQVIMLRLLNLGYVGLDDYNKFKEKFIKEESVKNEKIKERREKAKKLGKKLGGKRDWDKVYLNRVGKLTVKEVRNAYRKEAISFSEVTDILDVKSKYIEKFVGQ